MPKPFSLRDGDLRLDGELEKKDHHLVELRARMTGDIELLCDRCGNLYRQPINEELILNLVDEISQNKDDLDIIEFLDGVADISYIFESEKESFSHVYHFCTSCASDDKILEIEF